MSKRKRFLIAGGIIASLLLAAGLGYSIALNSGVGGEVSTSISSPAVSPPMGAVTGSVKDAATLAPQESAAGYGAAPSVGAPANRGGSAEAVSTAGDKLVIRSATISLQVDDLKKSLAGIRALALKNGAEIQSLTYTAGTVEPGPVPYAEGAATLSEGPKSAVVVLRVPESKLAATTEAIAKSGTVQSQSAAQDDVTQQYVDLSARLKNLKAQEARLRTFFAKAKKVDELIAVEQELARVRGEIEAMQAQVDYLERQAAMATLTIELFEPGAIVSPSGPSWGTGEAVTAGVRAAVGIVNGMIVIAIAMLPILLIGMLVFIVVRAVLRRRSSRTDITPGVAPEAPEETTD